MKEVISEFIRKEGVVFPKDFVLELYSQVMKFGPLSGLIQAGSRKAGERAGEIFKKYASLDKESVPEVIKEFISQTGFGNVNVSWEASDKLKLEVQDSFLLEAHSKPEVALRPLVGALEGFVSAIANCQARAEVDGKVIYVNCMRN